MTTYQDHEPGPDVDHKLRRRFWWTYLAGLVGFIACIAWGPL